MDLVMEHEAFARGRAELARAADELQSQRRGIEGRAGAFLGPGWSGCAGDAFHEAWDDWRAGAHDVQQGLTALTELLDVTRRAFRAQDEASRADLERVSARIVERLG